MNHLTHLWSRKCRDSICPVTVSAVISLKQSPVSKLNMRIFPSTQPVTTRRWTSVRDLTSLHNSRKVLYSWKITFKLFLMAAADVTCLPLVAECHKTIFNIMVDTPRHDLAGRVPGQKVPFVKEQALDCAPVGINHLARGRTSHKNEQFMGKWKCFIIFRWFSAFCFPQTLLTLSSAAFPTSHFLMRPLSQLL